jgi:hypothetical protein
MVLTHTDHKWEEGELLAGIPRKQLGGVTTVGEPSGYVKTRRHGKRWFPYSMREGPGIDWSESRKSIAWDGDAVET